MSGGELSELSAVAEALEVHYGEHHHSFDAPGPDVVGLCHGASRYKCSEGQNDEEA